MSCGAVQRRWFVGGLSTIGQGVIAVSSSMMAEVSALIQNIVSVGLNSLCFKEVPRVSTS